MVNHPNLPDDDEERVRRDRWRREQTLRKNRSPSIPPNELKTKKPPEPRHKFTRGDSPEQDLPKEHPPIRIAYPSMDAFDLTNEPLQYRRNLRLLDQEIDEIANRLMGEGRTSFWEQVKAVQREEKLYPETRYAELIRKRYPEAFKKRPKSYPPKWFGEKIGKRLTSKRSIRVFDKLNNIWSQFWRGSWTVDQTGDRDKCIKLAGELKAGLGCAFIDPELEREAVGERFGYLSWEVWRYREKMVRCGILKKFGKVGKVGRRGGPRPKVYAIGYWYEWRGGKFTVTPFLQEALMEAIAKEFGFKELEFRKRRKP